MRRLLIGLCVTGVVVYLVMFWPLRDPHPPARPGGGNFAIPNATVYISPDLPPLDGATIVVRNGRIADVGTGVAAPPGVPPLPCDRCVVTAGFWNAHVHFSEPKFNDAIWGHAFSVETDLEDMLTRRGFTTVVDAGSDPRVSVSLRRRIESGEIRGPNIYLAGRSIYPPAGIPYYVRESVPIWIRSLMPQPATAGDAVQVVRQNASAGADLTKLFTGSYVARGRVLAMRPEVAKAAVDEAHRLGQLVYSHPSDLSGTKVGIAAGVDILAHAPDSTQGIDDALLRSIVNHHMAMIPTLKMFETTVTDNPAYIQPIHTLVSRFRALGGELLFGTDVGYMEDYRTADEFRALAQCGLSPMEILRTLTLAPAKRFHVDNEKGTVEAGKLADLTILDSDPALDVTAFAQVLATIRAGRVIFTRTNN